MPDLFDLRNDYHSEKLNDSDIPVHPFTLFELWFNHAAQNKITDPNAMTLSTSDLNNKPSSRVVLLKSYDTNGFIFFSNYNSRKGKEIDKNPQASLLFFWTNLHRQIRIEGTITKTSIELSDAYFKSRPVDSQISAIISPQSEIVENRASLENKFQEMKKNAKTLTRPEWWGGYVLKPEYMEFWQGREGRLHDRICYSKSNDHWHLNRLAP